MSSTPTFSEFFKIKTVNDNKSQLYLKKSLNSSSSKALLRSIDKKDNGIYVVSGGGTLIKYNLGGNIKFTSQYNPTTNSIVLRDIQVNKNTIYMVGFVNTGSGYETALATYQLDGDKMNSVVRDLMPNTDVSRRLSIQNGAVYFAGNSYNGAFVDSYYIKLFL